jgi:hypothetical protein
LVSEASTALPGRVVGGVHGFNLFRPENIQPNPVPPPVAVTQFRAVSSLIYDKNRLDLST